MTIDEKYQALIALLKTISDASGGLAVAFSGGVDSSFLCYAVREALSSGSGAQALAITIASPLNPAREIEEATAFAAGTGLEQIVIHIGDIADTVAENTKERCYHCKKIVFSSIIQAAAQRGIHAVLDGSNVDDLSDYRPGMKALEELSVRSPLREAGLSKQDIRDLSRRFNLPTWDKPSFACLASRIPYGEKLSPEKLKAVEQAEEVLHDYGFHQYRVRAHSGPAGQAAIARIEVAPEERRRFFDEALLDDMSQKIKAAGFLYVALELEGYKMGSLNRALTPNT